MRFSSLRQTILLVAAFLIPHCKAQNEIIQLSPSEFHDMSTAGEFDLVIDVRTEVEWIIGHIENATFVEDLAKELADTDDYQATLTSLDLWGCRYCRVAVYCHSGTRARQALTLLTQAGFEGPLYNGLGVAQWTAMGYWLVKDPSKDDRPCMTVDNPVLVSRDQSGVCTMDATETETQTLVDVAVMWEPESAVSESYYEMAQMELDTNKELFLTQMSAQNTTTYSFLFRLSCFCPEADYPWRVTASMQQLMMGVKPNLTQGVPSMMLMNPIQTVMGDVVQSAVTFAGQEVLSMESSNPPPTYSIMDLFDRIQDAIDRQVFDIQVVYNDVWGYPEQIFIDYDGRTSDDEVAFYVSEFEVVEWADEDFEMMDTNTSRIAVDGGEDR